MGGATPGKVGFHCLRKQDEQLRESEPVNTVSP